MPIGGVCLEGAESKDKGAVKRHYASMLDLTPRLAPYHVMCRGNEGQPIFKELAKELHHDPAVLSRGLGIPAHDRMSIDAI